MSLISSPMPTSNSHNERPLTPDEQRRLAEQLPNIPQALQAEWKRSIADALPESQRALTFYRWAMAYTPSVSAEAQQLAKELKKLSRRQRR